MSEIVFTKFISLFKKKSIVGSTLIRNWLNQSKKIMDTKLNYAQKTKFVCACLCVCVCVSWNVLSYLKQTLILYCI